MQPTNSAVTANDGTVAARDGGSQVSRVSRKALVYCCTACALSDLNFSMLVPFFPDAAAARGCNSTITGVLFAVHQIVALVTSGVAPSVVRRAGGARVLTLSIGLQAGVTAAFAFTSGLYETQSFVLVCAALRACQGFAAGLSEVAGTGLLMRSVPDHMVGHALGWSEAARGAGIMVGPLLGGVLYELVGYSLPFVCSAAALGALALAMALSPVHVGKAAASSAGSSMVSLLGLPVVGATFFVCFGVMAAVAFLDPTIQPFMAKAPYLLSETQVGLVYAASLLCYTLLSLFAGPISQRLGSLTTLVLGLLVMGVSYVVMAPLSRFSFPLAPLPFLAQSTRAGAIGLALAALCAMGFGGALAFIPANALMVREAELRGISVDGSSDAIAALSMIAFPGGAAAGPLASGALVDALGFQQASAACGLFLCLLAPFILVVVGVFSRPSRRRRPYAQQPHDRPESCAPPPRVTGTMGESLLDPAATPSSDSAA